VDGFGSPGRRGYLLRAKGSVGFNESCVKQMKKFWVGLTLAAAMSAGFASAAVYYVGSKADIAAVQAVERKIAPAHNHILGVHVVGDYALLLFWSGVDWQHHTQEADDAFKRVSGERWTRIYSPAIGADTCSNLVQRGVPAAVEKQLCSGWGDIGS